MVVDYLLDEEIEVQLYEVEEEFDYKYEIFVNSNPFYESTYPDTDSYEMVEVMKKDIYEESFKKNKYSKKIIIDFAKKYDLSIAADSFF